MRISEVHEAKISRKLPDGCRQIVFTCDALEVTAIIRDIEADWDISVAVEDGQKFCMAKSPDGTQGWIERWRAFHPPRRVDMTESALGLSLINAIEDMRSQLCEDDLPMPEVKEEPLIPCEVTRVEADRGPIQEVVFRNRKCQFRTLVEKDWAAVSYEDKKGVYLLATKPDGSFLLEALIRHGRGGCMKRWQAEGDGDASNPEATIRALFEDRLYDAETFHRIDEAKGLPMRAEDLPKPAPKLVTKPKGAASKAVNPFSWPKDKAIRVRKSPINAESTKTPKTTIVNGRVLRDGAL